MKRLSITWAEKIPCVPDPVIAEISKSAFQNGTIHPPPNWDNLADT
jgi:hypothetical protein